jgi:hypothetical protein
MQASLNIKCYVAATRRREPLIAPHLKGEDPHIHFGSDSSTLPPLNTLHNLPTHIARDPRKTLGHFRAWNNHRELARLFLDSPAELGLFFEDDAVPNTVAWKVIVNELLPTAATFDVFSFHGRQLDPGKFLHRDCLRIIGCGFSCPRRLWVRPPVAGRIRCHGALAYTLTRRTAEFLAASPFDGTPIDVFLPNFGTFACLVPTIFNHDRRQGSLVDHHKGTRK